MMPRTLFHKVWDAHTVGTLPDGRTQLFVGLHLVHEVTSPQAFAALDELGLPVAYPQCTVATVDHIVPTDDTARPLKDPLAEAMLAALERNTAKHGIAFHAAGQDHQGIVHIIGPELGLTQPGMTVACGDSHTSTHGAFGAIALGIGTSQVRDVLATQTIALEPLRVRRVEISGALGPGVYAKDVALHVIRTLGVNGGVGFAYEFAGDVVDAMSMEERMTLCNMSIEGGARVGYVNPDDTTFAFLRGRPHAPQGEDWEAAVTWWRSLASDADAVYDDVVHLDGSAIAPTVTWGINPGQALGIDEPIPSADDVPAADRGTWQEALAHMSLQPGVPLAGTRVDVAFIGSCTNGRLSDLRAVAAAVKGHKVAPGVKALVVPGSWEVAREAEAEGIAQVLQEAGFEWRKPGCSMCLAMNPDKLVGDQLCASSSNRNFKGRQGSATGRTVLMSPVMVAAAAVTGQVADARQVFGLQGGAA
ncbi:MAG: 3-isopropylmalate dehydratase large subunit [Alphaproteobacteria bacterium]|nr:3-isopropylmalate dehydratase large subunit [Alphaproteobacteria bacterium]